MSIRFKLSFLITLLFIAATSNSLFTFWLESLGEEKLKWVNHTHEVLYTTENFLAHMTDAETGQRGFLLTKDISYLEPYHNGIALAKDEYLKLKNLTSDNAVQQEILAKIKKQMDLKFEELAETILLSQSGDDAAALAIVKNNHGKQVMDTLRIHVSSFTNNELILLEKRKGDFRENRAEITTLIFVEAVLFVFLSLVTFLFLHKSVFAPLKLLLKSAEKVEKGHKLEATDILETNEMGNLLSAFYVMGDKVYEREKTLNYKAKHDNLTGLRNRTTVKEEIEQTLVKAKEERRFTAILFMDLNKFKEINDTLGHEVGDLVLIKTAQRLTKSIRKSDIAFRLGGDEFLVILKHLKDTEHVYRVIEKIQTAFNAPADIKGNAIDISLSIGVAVAPEDSNDASQLMEYADVAMYAAKRDDSTDFTRFSVSMLNRSTDKTISIVS